MPRNICQCPRPPGGRVECSADNAAFCLVDDYGEFRSLCLPIAQSMRLPVPFGVTPAGAFWIVHELPKRLDPILARLSQNDVAAYVREILRQATFPATGKFMMDFQSINRRLSTSLPE